MTYHIQNESKLVDIAKELLATAQPGELWELHGELGAGKTAFVRACMDVLGTNDRVRSPSYNLLHVYQTNHPTIKQVVHLDLYRVQDVETIAEQVGLDEWKDANDALILVEWATAHVKNTLGTPARQIYFSHGEQLTERTIEVR